MRTENHPCRLLLAVVLSALGCVQAVPYTTKVLVKANPTQYEFKGELPAIRDAVIASLTVDRQRNEAIFGERGTWPSIAMFMVSDASNPLWGKEILAIPENAADLYLKSVDPLWDSPIYVSGGVGLPFEAEFHIHFASSVKGRTTISVKALKTRVINGQTWGMGHSGPGWQTRRIDVPPTTVEEYQLLRYFGKVLGVTDMPALRLPPK